MIVKKNNLFIPLAFEMLGFIIRIMMCYKPKEQFPPYHILQENNAALRFFTNSLKEIQSKSKPDPYEIYYLLRWIWKIIGYNDDSIDKILQKPERRIMKNDIEGLIESTITQIKNAIENKKPEEAKVYIEILVLLKGIPISHHAVDMNKPFENISNKHFPDALCLK